MNKMLFNEGGQPIYLDDLNFMQSSIFDAFKGVAMVFGDKVLVGCDYKRVSSNDYDFQYEGGYISMGGEIFQVDAGFIPKTVQGAYLVWKIQETDTNVVAFENGASNATHRLRKAYLTRVSKLDSTCMRVTQGTARERFELFRTEKTDVSGGESDARIEGELEVIVVGDMFRVVRVSFLGDPIKVATQNFRAHEELYAHVSRISTSLIGRGCATTYKVVGDKLITFKLVMDGTEKMHIFHDNSGGNYKLMAGQMLEFTFVTK